MKSAATELGFKKADKKGHYRVEHIGCGGKGEVYLRERARERFLYGVAGRVRGVRFKGRKKTS